MRKNNNIMYMYIKLQAIFKKILLKKNETFQMIVHLVLLHHYVTFLSAENSWTNCNIVCNFGWISICQIQKVSKINEFVFLFFTSFNIQWFLQLILEKSLHLKALTLSSKHSSMNKEFSTFCPRKKLGQDQKIGRGER